jgi:hypothetical protein
MSECIDAAISTPETMDARVVERMVARLVRRAHLQSADGKSGKLEKKRVADPNTKTGGKKKKVVISEDELFADSM